MLAKHSFLQDGNSFRLFLAAPDPFLQCVIILGRRSGTRSWAGALTFGGGGISSTKKGSFLGRQFCLSGDLSPHPACAAQPRQYARVAIRVRGG